MSADSNSTRSAAPNHEDRALRELREVLLRPTVDRVVRVEEKLERGGVDAKAVANHLPKAAMMLQGNDEFSRALAPTVEESIEVSVRKNPQPLVDAIFPVIGPAIRRSIQATLASMTEGMNSTLEHSFTLQGMKWRWQSIWGGPSFSERVLLNSLAYRVEQVLWIHNETGLLLANAQRPGLDSQDADLVSSMLGALQDYVGDSFGGEDHERESIREIEFGEQQLLMLRGPHSTVAALVRGRAGQEWRLELQRLLERLQRSASEELLDFDGDVEPFQSYIGELETVLEERQREKKKSHTVQFVLAALLVAGIFLTVRYIIRRNNVRSNWTVAEQRLEEEPGLIILSRRTEGEVLHLDVLRDPLAPASAELLRELIDSRAGRVEVRDIPFVSLDPQLVLRRAREELAPPGEVSLSLDGERLVVGGSAPHSWIQARLQRAAGLSGVGAVDSSALVDLDVLALENAVEALERETFAWPTDSEVPPTERVESWRSRIEQLHGLATAAGALVRVLIETPAVEGSDPRSGSRRSRALVEELQRLQGSRVSVHVAPPESTSEASVPVARSRFQVTISFLDAPAGAEERDEP